MRNKYLLASIVLLTPFFGVFAQEKPQVKLGGALRFNYNLSTWKPEQKQRGGDFGFDLFRLNAKAAYKGIKLNAEYRLYSSAFGGGILKQGWLGYDLDDKNELQLGLTQVPFGITQYNSSNWFFSINYYVGLEDDHDMGIKWHHENEKFAFDLAFFKNAEELQFGDASDLSNQRYSYDVSSIDVDSDGQLDYRNKEVNQLNGNFIYKFNSNKAKHSLGASAQFGGLYNLDTQKMGNHYAFAAYYQMQLEQLKIKAQLTHYAHNPKNPQGESDTQIAMGAYGAPYLVAAKANTYTFGASYNIPVSLGPISDLTIYNDFGYLQKQQSEFNDTFMNVTGMMVTAGSVYAYFDCAAGKNQPWLGPVWTNGLASGADNANWEVRFNINLGYYF